MANIKGVKFFLTEFKCLNNKKLYQQKLFSLCFLEKKTGKKKQSMHFLRKSYVYSLFTNEKELSFCLFQNFIFGSETIYIFQRFRNCSSVKVHYLESKILTCCSCVALRVIILKALNFSY